MIAKLILTSLLSAIVLYAWCERARSPFVAILALVAAVSGTYLTWAPSHASDLAEWAGIGRGVDLIIYVWVVISLLIMLNLHLKLRLQLELITSLARETAIANASNHPTRPRHRATSRSPQAIATIPASNRAERGSPNNKPPNRGVNTNARAAKG
jgi:hypothetical protein